MMKYEELWKSLLNKFSHEELAKKLAIYYIDIQRHWLENTGLNENEVDDDCHIIKYVRGAYTKIKIRVANKLKRKALKRLRSNYKNSKKKYYNK